MRVTLTCTIESDRDFFVIVGCTGTAARIWSPRLHPGFGRPRHHSAVSACTSSSLPHPCARPLYLLPAGGKASFAALNHVCVWKDSPSPGPPLLPSTFPFSPFSLNLWKPNFRIDQTRKSWFWQMCSDLPNCVNPIICSAALHRTMCGAAVDKQIGSQINLFLLRLYICLYVRVCVSVIVVGVILKSCV